MKLHWIPPLRDDQFIVLLLIALVMASYVAIGVADLGWKAWKRRRGLPS